MGVGDEASASFVVAGAHQLQRLGGHVRGPAALSKDGGALWHFGSRLQQHAAAGRERP